MADFVMPQTQYARSGDISIAYHVIGDGPIDLMIVPGAISQLEPPFAERLIGLKLSDDGQSALWRSAACRHC